MASLEARSSGVCPFCSHQGVGTRCVGFGQGRVRVAKAGGARGSEGAEAQKRTSVRSCRLAPWLIRARATSTKPSRAAMWRGVHPAGAGGEVSSRRGSAEWDSGAKSARARRAGVGETRVYHALVAERFTFLVSDGRVGTAGEQKLNHVHRAHERRPDERRVACSVVGRSVD